MKRLDQTERIKKRKEILDKLNNGQPVCKKDEQDKDKKKIQKMREDFLYR